MIKNENNVITPFLDCLMQQIDDHGPFNGLDMLKNKPGTCH